ncbi:hypothetical protein E3N88_36998 [Mikania micrantha]|uniref:Uncharacterized protein n=1 Tax=Mikania micrantha TaxID=192012 RepID=A0A5N6M5V8_9ASTR|nr:hypothetical protein E3N88_36998 [Mikania micrantha]
MIRGVFFEILDHRYIYMEEKDKKETGYRRRLRGGNGFKVRDDNGSLMLTWEDGFCRGIVEEMQGILNGPNNLIHGFRLAFDIASVNHPASNSFSDQIFTQPVVIDVMIVV